MLILVDLLLMVTLLMKDLYPINSTDILYVAGGRSSMVKDPLSLAAAPFTGRLLLGRYTVMVAYSIPFFERESTTLPEILPLISFFAAGGWAGTKRTVSTNRNSTDKDFMKTIFSFENDKCKC